MATGGGEEVNCEWLDAYFDGELDLARTLEFEEHLQSCADCRAELERHQVVRRKLQAPALRFKMSKKPVAGRTAVWRVLAIAASLAAVLLSVEVFRRPSRNEMLAQQVVGSHVRSLMADHLMDVPSTDQHTVKPWFNGKLDFAPVVKDLAAQGFPLVGGRLDYLDGRAVAALLYKRHQHTINLFEWPERKVDAGPERATINGYNLVHWARGGINYWAISDLNASELSDFVRDEER